MKMSALTHIFFSIFFGLLIFWPASHAAANPAALYNAAAAEAARINQNVPIERRIEMYQRIFQNLDQITSNFPDSPEALRIFTQQAQGTFNPSQIRVAFIADLNRYYNTVCEVTPTYRCLGFVSLNMGTSACQAARSFVDLEAAHRHLLNAAKVFQLRQQDRVLSNLVISVFRQCVTGRSGLTPWQSDFLISKLVSLLVQVGDHQTARAFVQGMSSPLFKFEGVLNLRLAPNETIDWAFLQRMDRFIDESMAARTLTAQDAYFASMQLQIFARTHATRVPRSRIAELRLRRADPSASGCDRDVASYVFGLVLELQRLGGSPYGVARSAHRFFMQCQRGDQYDLFLMAVVHGALLVRDRTGAQAAAFRAAIQNRSMSQEDIIAYYINVSRPNAQTIIPSFLAREGANPAVNSYRGFVLSQDARDPEEFDIQIFGNMRMNDNPAIYPLFKYLVDRGEICDASQVLFRFISRTQRYNEAIKYIVDFAVIDPANPPRCGDAELEMLLR